MVKFKLELNKEQNSLVKIIKDNLLEVTLTENELESLAKQIHNLRSDVFENITTEKDIELNKVNEELEYAKEEIQSLKDRIDELEEEEEG